ncbi:hypothetical protein LCGC14_2142210 [marine sediment metagenome]|uniref:Uncharacterized protein n=1 Tax=marine sediment metagenome TaxID=412755 RepID=A0A0F9GB58_9ZZZZ
MYKHLKGKELNNDEIEEIIKEHNDFVKKFILQYKGITVKQGHSYLILLTQSKCQLKHNTTINKTVKELERDINKEVDKAIGKDTDERLSTFYFRVKDIIDPNQIKIQIIYIYIF